MHSRRVQRRALVLVLSINGSAVLNKEAASEVIAPDRRHVQRRPSPVL
jgi:hypothetical protein